MVKYMVDNGVGVSEITSYKIKKVDLDYFTEE
jgi:restriction endonuclease Mrr